MRYLDNQASTPIDSRVLQEMFEVMRDSYANPHSIEHKLGLEAAAIVEDSIDCISNIIGCDSDEIIITSGATESNNLALIGLSKSYNASQYRNTILISEIEHKSILETAEYLSTIRFYVKKIPVDNNGVVDLDKYNELLDDRTLLVSIMLTNSEIGTIQDIKKLAQLAHECGAIFHTDAAQAYYEELDVYDMDIDMMSMSSHKIYGPKGVGLLYISRDIKEQVKPIIYGGSQQYGIRSGTVPTFLVYGFARALKYFNEDKRANKKLLASRAKEFLNSLETQGISYSINGSLDHRHPGNLNLTLDVAALEFINKHYNDFCISTGSACNNGNMQISYVLRAIGVNEDVVDNVVRISF